MTKLAVFQFILGLGLLTIGGDLLVRGSARLAAIFGVSTLVIGLTVVAFGTSAPELAVSLQATLTDKNDLAIGNIVGSNIFNILLILGVSAVIVPLFVQSQLIRLDLPVMIGASFLMYLFAMDGSISRLEGFILFLILCLYTTWLILGSRKEEREKRVANSDYTRTKADLRGLAINMGFVISGSVALMWGSDLLVESSLVMARALGVSELVIGLTIVSAGTSLPEVAASVAAALKKERDIAVGNVIGSNIFNIFSVLGLTALLSPLGVSVSDSAINFDMLIMLIAAAVCIPIFFRERIVSRADGALLLGGYLLYIIYIYLSAVSHPLLGPFTYLIGYLFLPLVAILLLLSTFRSVFR